MHEWEKRLQRSLIINMQMLYKQHIIFGFISFGRFHFPAMRAMYVPYASINLGWVMNVPWGKVRACRSLELFHDFLYDRTRGHSNFSPAYTSRKCLYLNVMFRVYAHPEYPETREFSTLILSLYSFFSNNCIITEEGNKEAV